MSVGKAMQPVGRDVEVVKSEQKYSKNRCCFRLLHVKIGAQCIGILHLLYFIYELFSTIYLYKQTGCQHTLSFSLSCFGILLAVIAVLLLFCGMKLLTPYLLVPHLLMQFASILMLCAMASFCLFSAVAGTSLDIKMITVEDSQEGLAALKTVSTVTHEDVVVTSSLALVLILLCVLLLVIALIEVWMFTIVLGCYSYLQQESFTRKCEPRLKLANCHLMSTVGDKPKSGKNSTLQTNSQCRTSSKNNCNNGQCLNGKPAETDC